MNEFNESMLPRRARECFEKGMIALERNSLPYAMDMFMAALKIEPRYLKARKFLRAAEIRVLRESKAGAFLHIFSTIGGLPKIIQAQLALKSGKAMRALELAEELLRTDPINLLFINLLVQAAQAAQMPEIAIQTLEIAREFHATRPDILMRLGQLYTATNQMEQARKTFETLVDLRPNDPQIAKAYKDAMARDSMIKGGWTETSKDGDSFRSVIKDVKEASILEQEGRVIRDAQNLDALIDAAVAKIKQEPDNVNHRRQLANLYVEAHRFNDAIRAIQESRRIPGIEESQLDQAMAEVRIKQLDSEINDLRNNGDLEGAARKEAEKSEFMFKDIKARVERYPNDLALRLEYGIMLFESGELTEAIQQFQLAQRFPRARIRALYYLGLCFRDKQQYDLARDQLEKAAAELPMMNDLKKEIFYTLGSILESMGKPGEAAEKYFKEIYQTDIGYKDVAQKMEAAYKGSS